MSRQVKQTLINLFSETAANIAHPLVCILAKMKHNNLDHGDIAYMNILDTTTAESEQIKGLIEKWGEGLLSLTAAEFVSKFYTNDALLIPTLSDKLCLSFDDKVAYFEKFIKLQPQLELDQRGSLFFKEEYAFDAGLYTFHFPEQEAAHARYTFLYKKCKGHWMIVHHHSSLLPE